MRKDPKLVFLLSITLILIAQTCTAAENREKFSRDDAIRVLILSGRNNHDWRQTTPFLKKVLLSTGLFDVRVTEEPSGLSSHALAPYDLLVLDYMGPRWNKMAEKAVTEFVASGKGLVVVHGASYAFSGLEVLGDRHVRTGIAEPPWAEYAKLIGGVWSKKEPKTGHGDRHSFTVRFIDREHPISQGMGESFVATDELYHDLQMEPTARILATAYSDPARKGTGEDEPILWTLSYGKGRVFHSTLGHNLSAMNEAGFISTFARGCEWAAMGKVSLPAEIDLNAHRKDALRTLVVTGGHSYDTEFYSLFAGDWLIWSHSLTDRPAFASDIRDKYDVVVLYDLSREIDENGRRNLRHFVESGKGLVVIHHAIADYNSWNWWWRDVVGGRYILPDGDKPASGFKHDVELFVRPVGNHPVTAGIGPMHLWDETYKNMWISPEVKVILETDNETSDGPIAWISPYKKSKVIYIQLGHGREAHLHPGYRELVKRAILWSAGRLE